MHGDESTDTASLAQDFHGADGAASDAICWVFPETPASATPRNGVSLTHGIARVTPIYRTPLRVGRGVDMHVQLEGQEISRRHAEILRRGSFLTVRDLGSRNGVFVDGMRVAEAPLRTGSVLRFGEWIGVVAKAAADSEMAVFAEFMPGLFGGPVLRASVELARQAAASTLPIILEGETGTGKEVFARAIHAQSGRSGPFQALNCAALPEGLAEAELFGYRKGAFTGAERTSAGIFRAAHNGTLLLDEIADMPLPLQAKVLRVLEQSEVVPLGETTPVPVNVRVIAAAQSSLREAASRRAFRGDLLARLDGIKIRLPPLRERVTEIPWIFQRLLMRHCGTQTPRVEARFVEQLCLYDWPFNVRELDLLTRRLVSLHAQEPALKVHHLPEHFAEHVAKCTRDQGVMRATPCQPAAAHPTLAPSQRERDSRDVNAFIGALRAAHGNVARAAATVGISRQRAYRLIGGTVEVNLEELRATLPCAPSRASSAK